MKTKALVLALGLLAGPALAADHLYPEPSFFAGDLFMPEYPQEVARTLQGVMDRDVVLRMIELPSFVPEHAVGVRKVIGHYEIFSVAAAEQVWNYEGRHSDAGKIIVKPDGNLDYSQVNMNVQPGKWEFKIPLNRCSVAISDATADLLSKLWERALLQTRFDESQDFGADGTVFHFAMRKGYSFMAGQAWTPRGPLVSGLAKVGYAMQEYCDSKSPAKLQALTAQASDLLKKMP